MKQCIKPSESNNIQQHPQQADKNGQIYNGKGTLIAMLGPPFDASIVPQQSIIVVKTMAGSGVKDQYSSVLLRIVYQLAPAALYVLCQTTFDERNALVDPGTTAEALTWLMDNWPKWKKEYKLHTMILYLPYGGKYLMDEEVALNRAHSMGIIPIAAAGSDYTGITFPSKLATVICVGGSQEDGTVAQCSPQGRELDVVAPVSACFGKYCISGISVSAAYVVGQTAQLCQHLFANINASDYESSFCVTILKELLQASSQHNPSRGFGMLTCLFDFGAVNSYFHHVTRRRDRQDKFFPDAMLNDSIQNNQRWLSTSILKEMHRQNEDFPVIKGNGITIAMVDTFDASFLECLTNNSISITWVSPGVVGYFYIMAHLVLDSKYQIHLPKNHALRCASIIANTVPQCNLLMIIRHVEGNIDKIGEEEGVKIALSISELETADILILSASTTDTLPMFWSSVSSHLRLRIVISAAGNDGKDAHNNSLCYLARAGGVISMGACDQYGNRCPYSSVGREIDFLAPGQFSTADSSGKGGTCYSSSAAAAFIALLLQYIDINFPTATTTAWLLEEGRGQWRERKISSLARNTHLMRALLSSKRLRLCFHTEHNYLDGFGQLLLSSLVTLTPDAIRAEISNFYSTV